jgi:very-short-patch-repair endonuclease
MRNLYATVAVAAAEQWGVVTWGQLRAAGLAASTLVRWARTERLHRIHRGVYSLVPAGALAPQGRWLAGVLAAGPGAVLSHRSAAAHWELLDDQLRLPEVTVPIDGARSVRGVLVHRSRSLAGNVTRRQRIPVTTLERTIADLADVVSRPVLHRAAQQADFRRRELGPRGDPWRHAHGRRGAPLLRTLPELQGRAGSTRSDLERRMLALCRTAGLPEPECNQLVAGHRVDFVWRAERLVVETDGRQAHLTPSAFEVDRRRDVDLMVAGWRVARFTWAMVSEEPRLVAARLARLLDV